MKNQPLIILVAVVIILVLVAGYFVVKVIHGGRSKVKANHPIIGTWITESGDEKLVISKRSLIYTDKSYDSVDTCTYITEHYDSGLDEFVLLPTKDNEMVHDVGTHIKEFRKKW